ncbi:ABC transporter permease [Pusillimonas sp. ANT_WB101]|uniref:ABC transporter permease n=1 Tax=Pusillimonas sp. ANT_WB101 TaxID=2597356 RepID=UPI001CAA89AC|nr:ABC transporter permease [Pusillimonas sp. ANT_WB101]
MSLSNSAQQVATDQDMLAVRKKRKHSPILWFSGLTLLFCVLVAVFAPLLQPYDPTAFVSYTPFEPSSAQAWLGTDFLGRDVLSRLIGGARLTLLMAVSATLIAHAVGNVFGLYAAVRGGWVDMVLCRLVDVILSLPKIIVGLVIVAALGSSIEVIVVMTGLIYSASVFRIARSLGLDVSQQDFVTAARARGEGTSWIIFGEIVPHVVYPLAADFAIRVSFAILFMSSLSFLGLGVQPPFADWGGLVRENLDGIANGSYASIYAALAIAVVSVALNLLVDATGEESAFAESQK